MTELAALRVRIFADGADLKQIEELAANPLVKGFTTNPTLMRKAGVTDYAAFAKDAIQIVGNRPISFEVFADDFTGMERQARVISGWGENVNVKIPVTTTHGTSTAPVVERLIDAGVKVNVTAVMSGVQIMDIARYLQRPGSFLSIFAGRIADTGRDPAPFIMAAKTLCKADVIWASPREVLNIWQADQWGCDIITVSPDILAKLGLVGKNLDDYSLETVRMFHRDAAAAGYVIDTGTNDDMSFRVTGRAA